MSQVDYKKEVLKRVSEKELDEWLEKNPLPKLFKGDKYVWAFLQMPVGKLFSILRRKLL